MNLMLDNKLLTRLNASRSGVSEIESGSGFGFEMKKMKRGMLRRGKSMSSSSTSSGGGSVMEWESVTESESKGSSGFSLLVYAYKSLLMMTVTGKLLRSCKQISDQKSCSWFDLFKLVLLLHSLEYWELSFLQVS
ncbi:hypothetical protein E3N88_39141 [Mikania micrantha]|uniref:Uncharacterized protein n=1 Tax=Mikania micrantha TaxID=192012 RepID=A0A5N6LVX4_9ASTR|nr:hypothetical protein E3N88_39141 [Mikania micrantha]